MYSEYEDVFGRTFTRGRLSPDHKPPDQEGGDGEDHDLPGLQTMSHLTPCSKRDHTVMNETFQKC